MSSCPRCGAPLAPGQEYCLECGVRVRDRADGGFAAGAGQNWLVRAGIALVVAVVGAAVAIAAGGRAGGGDLLTAVGGFATVPAAPTLPLPPETGPAAAVEWPTGEDGWTIVLASVPQASGMRTAEARAREASRGGLTEVGILDSSRFASLHPGYWLVFTGVYASEAEATSALQPARKVSRTATVRRIVP
jgi:hypothetical protein